ncbi:hypothetical protein ACTFIY_004548 [Dictyostelium cf. discoideum]
MKYSQNKSLNTFEIEYKIANKAVKIKSSGGAAYFDTWQWFNLSNTKLLLKVTSETICQLSKCQFNNWFAGIIDGDGNFDIRKIGKKEVLKAIRIKLHVRDIRILTRIQNELHIGRIRIDKNKLYALYIISTNMEMRQVIARVNGLIRLKVDSFERACKNLEINFKEANYILEENDNYLAGLIDTDGTIVFNYASNRIECNLEIKFNKYSEKLNLEKVIPQYTPVR